eukprot:jgi/Mesvir1/27064/Mv20756-RA.1
MTTVAPNKMRELKPQELIKCCEEIFATFNPGKVTPDSYADECLEKWRLDPENDDAVFIKQVFYGCLRYNKLIKTLLASFFHVNASSASRSDANLFTVFCYLILLRLEELTFEQFRRLVLSQDPLKMATLIQFVFSEQKLNEYCKDQWLQLYDVQYVEDLLKTTVDWAPQVEELLQILEETAFAKKKGKEEELENWMGAGRQTVTTVVKPFTLSQPKPKPAPPPEEPPPKYKAKAAPPVTKGLTKEQQALEAAKEANRKRLEARNATGGVFRLRVLERPSNLDKVQAEVEAQRSEESKYIPIKARPVPAAPSVPVKLNAAAILREDAVYRKRMEEQARLIKAYETELRDSSTFESWREEMQAMDSERRAAEIERRRQEMADAQQAAIDARRNKVAENQETAAELKDEMRELMARRQAELAVLEEINRAKKEQIVEERKGVKVAQERLVSEKRQKAEELQQEKAELSRRLAEERAAEQARREDLIRQLRAIDAVPKEKVAIFDPTAASGVGLLEEMSIAELRERLALAKERRAEQQQQQRAEILKQKQQKESLLLSKAASISRLRDMQAAQRAMRKAAAEGERAQSEQASREKREQDMLDLHARWVEDGFLNMGLHVRWVGTVDGCVPVVQYHWTVIILCTQGGL